MTNQGWQGPEPEKLSELRAKTDNQLLKLICSRLELGFDFIALSKEAYSEGNRNQAEHLLRRAEQIAAEAHKLLPALAEGKRRIVDPKLDEFGEEMVRLCQLHARPSACPSLYCLAGESPAPPE